MDEYAIPEHLKKQVLKNVECKSYLVPFQNAFLPSEPFVVPESKQCSRLSEQFAPTDPESGSFHRPSICEHEPTGLHEGQQPENSRIKPESIMRPTVILGMSNRRSSSVMVPTTTKIFESFPGRLCSRVSCFKETGGLK